MKARHTFVLVLVLAIAAGYLWWQWQHDKSRRDSLKSLQTLCIALETGNRDSLLQSVVLPQAVRNRTGAEQAEFLSKALSDEISPEGLAVLKREGQFGPLKKLFPNEAESWANQAGVKLEDCIAFKIERNGVRAEAVLVKETTFQASESGTRDRFRIVRLNNVKQLASPNLSTKGLRP